MQSDVRWITITQAIDTRYAVQHQQETLWSRNRDSFLPFSNRIHFDTRWGQRSRTFPPISCSECYDNFRGSEAFLKNRGTTITTRSWPEGGLFYIFQCADHVHTEGWLRFKYDIFVFKSRKLEWLEGLLSHLKLSRA